MTETQRAVRIARRAADRLRGGHLWVYRTELIDTAAEPIEPGALVTVEDSAGRPVGTGLYSAASQIAVRLVSRSSPFDRGQYLQELRERVAAAFARRRVVAPLSKGSSATTNAQRLIFSEADNLPGIVADRYADLVVVQLLTQGTAQDDVRDALARVLRDELAPGGEALTVWERPDARIRELEQLGPSPETPLFTNQAGSPTSTSFELNGLRFGFDTSAGQKTGAFLDQRQNYAAAAEWVERSGHTGHALDVCTYQGGFALHLARVCERVTGVDQSHAALEIAERNLQLNADLSADVSWIEADAFELLRALDEASRPGEEMKRPGPGSRPAALADLPQQFDAIVLDPPAFAKSKRAAEGALRGYKEMNLRAMRLLRLGGTLITCSCSHHVPLETFTAAVAEAAADAGRRVQLLQTMAAAPDHPEVLTLPETRYLKCLICRVD